MAARTWTLITATTTAALLLTACGGSGADDKPDATKGAATGSPSATAPASASASSDVTRPTVTLPNSFKLTFQSWTSSDPVKQAVLNDGKEQLRAGYAAITADTTNSKALTFYNTRAGLSQVQQWIKTYTDKNLTVIGKLPVYDPKVNIVHKNGATLSYCTDESKAYSKDRKTGEEEGNPAGMNPHVYYVITLARNADGVWQTMSAQSQRGDCSQ
ncbi:hypothetical protein [Streptomyces sp. L2]|uniref:hypothetical protein n=1 Tax=Streptomyces sp. L2 TaxID=2162665 RepID=UPI001011697E|nr:hypothetical protein [Streptomyces sp. L2]